MRDARVALNSFIFFEDIVLSVLDEQANPTSATPAAPNHTTVYEVMKAKAHRLVLSKDIQREYEGQQRQRYSSLGLSSIVPVLQHLESRGLVVKPNLDPPPRIRTRLPPSHRGLLKDAIRGRAHFFVTQRPEWLDIAHRLHREGIRTQIVSRDRYISLGQ